MVSKVYLVSRLFMSSQLLLLYNNYDQSYVCCDNVALYSHVGVALRQFVLY